MSSASGQAARQRYSDALQSSLSLAEVGEAFLANVESLVQADALGMYRFLPGDLAPLEVLSCEYEFLDSYEKFGRADDPVLQFALEHRRPIDSSRVVSEARWLASGAYAALAESDLTHSLEAPVIASGCVVGTINFARTRRSGGFSKHDLGAVRFASEQLSLAIERGLRFEETGRRLSTLESALNRVPEGIIVSDVDAQMLYCNRAAERWLTARPEARRVGELSQMIDDAVAHFRQGKRVHVGNLRDAEGTHMMVKSWILGEKNRALVTLVSGDDGSPDRPVPLLAVLSPREQEIAELVSQGLSTRRIAERAFITENTVKQHLKRIFAKTDAHSRAELVQLMWSASRRNQRPNDDCLAGSTHDHKE